MSSISTDTRVGEPQPAGRPFAASQRILQLFETWVGTIVVTAVVGYFTFESPSFLSLGNFTFIAQAACITFFISLGVMMSLTVDGFDLSVGAVASFASTLSAGIMVLYDLPYELAIIVPVVVGASFGLVNGLIIVKFGLPDLTATLGTMFVIGGAQQVYSGGQNIYTGMFTPEGGLAPGAIGDDFTWIINGRLLGFPVAVLLIVVVGAIFFYLMDFTRWGRLFYATGDNREAADIAGVPVNRYRIAAYTISGACAGFAGVLLTAFLNAGEAQVGMSYLLNAVTVVFLGASFFGRNRVGVVGTLVGAFIIAALVNGLTMINMPYTTQDVFKGSILLLAVGLGVFIKNQRAKYLR